MTRRRSTVTQAEIARSASVSPKTVSLALRGDDSVSEVTRKRIRDIASQLGYVGHHDASRAVGVITPFIGHIAYAELTSHLRAAAASYDLIPLIGESSGIPELERRLITELEERGVLGLILISPRLSLFEVDAKARASRSIVTINASVMHPEDYRFGSVQIDHKAGAREAMKYLLETGHKRFVYLAGRLASSSEQQRRAGLTEAAEHNEVHIVEIGGEVATSLPTPSVGYERCLQALAKYGSKLPDAIVAYNDAMAFGALHALREHNIAVSERLSVVGFDLLSLTQFWNPPLTTSGVEWDRVAWEAMAVLSLLIEGREPASVVERYRVLVPELVVRDSVRDRT